MPESGDRLIAAGLGTGTLRTMTASTAQTITRAFTSPDAELHVAVAYENVHAGVCGKLALDRIAHELGEPQPWRISLWPFRLLEVAAFREHASEQSAAADVLVIAASGEAPLPDGVRDWLRWTIEQDCARPRMLAALLHGFGAESQIASPVYAGLKACARKHGLDFLSAWTATLSREKTEPDTDGRKKIRRPHTPAPMPQDLLYPATKRP